MKIDSYIQSSSCLSKTIAGHKCTLSNQLYTVINHFIVFLSLTQVFAQQQNHPASPGNLLSSSGHEAIVSGKVPNNH